MVKNFDIEYCMTILRNNIEASDDDDFDTHMNQVFDKLSRSKFHLDSSVNTLLFRMDSKSSKFKDVFIKFDNPDLIDTDIDYKILSTLKYNKIYKGLLYALLKVSRPQMIEFIEDIKKKEEKIYENLIKLVKMYESSQLYVDGVKSGKLKCLSPSSNPIS